jgi:hypothetical protein
MKILFLDIDGVLITEASARYYRWLDKDAPESDKGWRTWCPIATNNLRILLDRVPDLQIVLSSSWRTGRTIKECADLLEENDIDRTRMVGRTGATVDSQPRGIEIQLWLDEHPEVIRFAILDDDSDMAHLMDRLFKTEFSVGLTLPSVQDIYRHFKTEVPT